MTSFGHARSTSLIEPRNIPMASGGVFSPPPPNGRHGGDNRPGAAPIPHIDDILKAPRDVDMTQSMRKLLESAEASLRQAELSRDFNRPAVALKEYIRASVIAVQLIQSHRDYVFLRDEHNDVARIHSALLKKISQQDASFGRIKQDIIADNKRTGVAPVGSRPGSSQGTDAYSRSRSESPTKGLRDSKSSNNAIQPQVNGSPARTKPAIQPKPPALHGNAISSNRLSLGLSTSAAQDLAARFANLRGPQPSPGQDPRIKTHPLPKPAGPRSMPPPPPRPPKIDISTNVPSLPKMPDAVYSPARGSISGESSRPPLSTPRGTFTRTGSTASSVPGTPTSASQPQTDYFSPTQSYTNTAIPPTAPPNPIPVPQGETITAEELKYAMTCRGSILLIDVRAQEDFNEGHIMARSVICIEPSILMRENLSADQIAESLVLSPNNEEMEFQDRAKKDLIVFYDQDSEAMPRNARNPDGIVLVSLRRALVDFNYGNELKNQPKLLKGGIDAWIDLMGRGSLQSVSQNTLSRKNAVSEGTRGGPLQRSKSKFTARSHKPAVAKAWEETIRNEEMETASSPTFVRTVDDFHRKFPPVPEKESMTSPTQPSSRPAYGSSHKVDLNTDLPSPPARPVPALPRSSFSRLSEEVDDTASIPPPRPPTKAIEQQSTGDSNRTPTGLNNPRNWCYANSLLQCLLASPEFGRELANSVWAEKYKAPKKKDEKIDNPQLMTKIISNLFHWMSTGKFQYMKAQTLMVSLTLPSSLHFRCYI
ncbi:hypothetical protein BGZ63DRAFT_376798 [Mariannaea sp. PMI_226]|nr:hypothetical protein BGZ63DRAFT_376798 [Mariannaea sp. PMI_226]